MVLFCFAGRQANLELQRPFVDRILRDNPAAEYHLWDLTRTPEDAAYVRAQQGERVTVHRQLHPGHPLVCNGSRRCGCVAHRPPYEKSYAWYARRQEFADALFVKIDDDVVFMETDRFDGFLDVVAHYPGSVVSANAVNNVVCAKHDPDLAPLVRERFRLGAPDDRTADRAWWRLHTMPEFARFSHEWFLTNRHDLRVAEPSRSRPGEQVSINTIAFTHATLMRMVGMIGREPRLGDEGAVDRMLPRIASGFRVAHLTFGPQEKVMTLAELDDLRSRYAIAGKEHLS